LASHPMLRQLEGFKLIDRMSYRATLGDEKAV
jgi:hypothetical protein